MFIWGVGEICASRRARKPEVLGSNPRCPARYYYMSMIEIIGTLAAIITTASGPVQFFKTIKTRNTESFSLLFLILLTVGQTLWLFYGIGIGSMPLIISNILSALVGAIMLSIKLKNCMKQKEE